MSLTQKNPGQVKLDTNVSDRNFLTHVVLTVVWYSQLYLLFAIARSDEFHRALLFKAQQSINNNLNHIIVQNMAYRGRQGRVNSELTFDLSDIY